MSRSALANAPLDDVWHATIGFSHGICRVVKPGDSFELSAINCRPWDSDDICDVTISVYEFWEPSSVMLRLAGMSIRMRQ